MSQASMQFAPQWLKKPSLTSTSSAPSLNGPGSGSHPSAPQGQGQHRTASPPIPRTATPPAIMTGLSYSHMANPSSARSESFPSDGAGSPNGYGHGAVDEQRPFRYAREAMLALYDPALVRSRPLELLELGEAGAVILSEKPNAPVGTTEMSEEEKKIFASSLNPPMRQRPAHTHPSSDVTQAPAPYLRRGPNASISGAAAVGAPGRATIGGGFGRGEGGAFGGGKPDSEREREGKERDSGYARAPERERGERAFESRDRERYAGTPGRGAGGAFGTPDGDDSRRNGPLRRTGPIRAGDAAETASPAPRQGNTAATWRPSIRNNSLSGASFEGVLGFGGAGPGAAAGTPSAEQRYPATAAVESPGSVAAGGWRERERVAAERERFGAAAAAAAPTGSDRIGGVMPLSGGGSGWSKGGGRWRQAAQADASSGMLANGGQEADPPVQAASVAPGPSETPVEERMEQLRVDEEEKNEDAAPATAQSIDPENVQWFYTDPQGLQQGPFTASQMQDWYSHGYFVDTLPLRRDHEAEHRTLAAVKAETGDILKPFLTRPLPPREPTPPPPVQPIAPPPQVAPSPFQNAGFANGMAGQMYQQQPIPQQPFDAYNQMSQPMQPRSVWDNPALQARQSPFLANVAPIGSPFGQQAVPGYFGGMNPMGSPQVMPLPQAPYQAVSPWGNVQQQHSQSVPQPDVQHFNAAPAYQQQPLSQATDSQVPQQPPAESQPQAASPWSSTEAAHVAAAPTTVDQTSAQSEAPVSGAADRAEAEAEPAASGHVKPAETQPAPELSLPTPEDQSPIEEDKAAAALPAKPTGTTPGSKTTALPPPPASLPAKPVTTTASPAKAATIADKSTATPDAKPKKAAKEAVELAPIVSSPAPKTAPWAAKEDEKTRTPSGPSLREIQEAEAKQAEARKQAEAKAKAAAAAASASQSASTPQGNGEALANMSWGLPSKPSAAPAASPSANGPSTPVWGQEAAASKKTLKQIQEEEEKRAKAQAAAKAAASGSAAAVPTRRGYADLAAGPTQSAPGWSTVGAGGKTTQAPTQPAARPATAVPAKPMVSMIKPATPAPSPAKKASPATLNEVTPTADFIRWTKESLTGLKGVNMDEFVQMLLTFPVEPASAERQSTLEIISDSVYANSSTLDGRRFAQEFYAKRKADAQAQLAAAANGKPIASSNSLADVVKAQPKAVNNDFGAFKIVKSKSKGRK